MRIADLLPILPLCVLAAGVTAALLLIALRRHHGGTAALTVVALALACASVPLAARHAPGLVTPLLIVDGYTLFYQALVLLAALAVALTSYGYLEDRETGPREEYYVLLLLATLGAATLPACSHFASFFVALETLSLSLVGLIAYRATLERPMEAGIKYLMLSGISSAFLLFGIALTYTALGTLSFLPGVSVLARPGAPDSLYRFAGIAMILVGIGFKLSVVPFHLWAPDVYEGAPAPITGFVAVVSKTAVFALLLRFFLESGIFAAAPLIIIVSAIAVLSMLAGNLLALLQSNVKRLLAYSSIAHLGYALVAFLAGGALAIEAVSAYLVAYAVTTLGAFGVVSAMSRSVPAPDAERDADDIADYRGLYRTRPWLAVVFTAMLLSLAGIPLTVGFIAKFYAMSSGVDAKLAAPVAALVLGSIVGLYYYLRVIVAMIQPPPALERRSASEREPSPASWLGHAVLAALLVLLIGLGVYPAPLVTLIRTSAVTLAETAPASATELAKETR